MNMKDNITGTDKVMMTIKLFLWLLVRPQGNQQLEYDGDGDGD